MYNDLMSLIMHTYNSKFDWELSWRGFETELTGGIWATTVVIYWIGIQWTNYHLMNFTGFVRHVPVGRGTPSCRKAVYPRRCTIIYCGRGWAVSNPWNPHFIFANWRYLHLQHCQYWKLSTVLQPKFCSGHSHLDHIYCDSTPISVTI